MSYRTCYMRLGIALAAAAMLATTGFAQTCLQDEYNKVNKQKLTCTANDVRIAQVTNIRDPLTGKALTTCFQGTQFNFLADFEIVTSSTSSRSNIGMYIATASTTQALTGTCVDNIIQPQHPCPSDSSLNCGSDNYHELDPAPDNCGDTSSTDVSPEFGKAAEAVTLEVDNFNCTAPAGSNTLVLPNCTSWQIPGGTIQCVSPAPDFPYPFNGPGGTPTAIPGSPSKCNCEVISLPITPVNPKPLALKACNTNLTSTAPSFTFDANNPPGTASPTNCDAGVEGVDTATYTVAIDNPNVSGTTGDIIVDQICDSAYGQVFPATGSCKAGSTGQTINNTSCSALDIPLGQSATCTFTAPSIGESNTVSNVVTVSGHSKVNTAVTWTANGTNSVSVHSEEAPSTATVTKGVATTTAACATVRYTADVKNTSGADENLSLSGLSDSAFGDLTKCTNAGCTNTGGTLILGTTCGVASNSHGLGTLSGSLGAGAFAASLPVGGNDYTCEFDAQFCSALDANSCISNTDTITPSLSGDEATDKVTVTANDLTVKECLTTTVTSN